MEWRPVVGYEGYLEVSDDGRIRTVGRYVKSKGNSVAYRPSRELKLRTINGYVHTGTTINGKEISIRVSRAVAMAFIPNSENKPQVDHIDCDKTNNNVSNLRWVTAKENVMYADMNGLRDHAYKSFIEKTKDPVFQSNAIELAAQYHRKKTYCFSLNGELIAEYKSCRDAAKENNCSFSGVSACCKGILPTLNGKIYSYDRNRFQVNQGELNVT